jgi:hypothetical protein
MELLQTYNTICTSGATSAVCEVKERSRSQNSRGQPFNPERDEPGYFTALRLDIVIAWA